MRKNISLTQPVEDRAAAIMEARGFNGLSDMIATLVREEYERRHPPQIGGALREDSNFPAKTEATAGQALDSYKKHLRRRKGRGGPPK